MRIIKAVGTFLYTAASVDSHPHYILEIVFDQIDVAVFLNTATDGEDKRQLLLSRITQALEALR